MLTYKCWSISFSATHKTTDALYLKGGPGKTTYTFSVMFRFLLPPRLFSMLPAAGEGVGQVARKRKVHWR